MTIQEKYLSLYKEYEGLLRNKGEDIKEKEESSDNIEGNRLRICRQIRNYLSHVDDIGFIAISDKMIAYLENKVKELREEEDIAKKHIKKPNVCILSENTKCSEAVEIFKKLKCTELLVQNNDNSYATINVFEVLGVKSTQKISTLKLKKTKVKYCNPLDKYISLDNSFIILCTDNGTENGKLLGQIWFA